MRLDTEVFTVKRISILDAASLGLAIRGMELPLSKTWTECWLSISEWYLLLFGVWLVFGVIGEHLAEHKKKDFPFFKKHKATWSALVVLTIAGELFSDGGIFLFGSHLQTISDVEVSRANEHAYKAEKEAQQFRLKADELEAKLQPRMITDANLEKFINSLTNCPKMPIKVMVGLEDGETYRFANRIRDMLNRAGFSDGGNGVTRMPGGGFIVANKNAPYFIGAQSIFLLFNPGMDANGKQIEFVFTPFSIDFKTRMPGLSSGLTNNPVMLKAGIGEYVKWAFSEIDVPCASSVDKTTLKPGECGIFVPTKNH